MKEYRILYSAHSKSGSHEQIEVIEATTDEEALQKYQAFKQVKEAGKGKFYWSYLVNGGLVRVDQKEITTKIL